MPNCTTHSTTYEKSKWATFETAHTSANITADQKSFKPADKDTDGRTLETTLISAIVPTHKATHKATHKPTNKPTNQAANKPSVLSAYWYSDNETDVPTIQSSYQFAFISPDYSAVIAPQHETVLPTNLSSISISIRPAVHGTDWPAHQ
jgi:hypothetical protein